MLDPSLVVLQSRSSRESLSTGTTSSDCKLSLLKLRNNGEIHVNGGLDNFANKDYGESELTGLIEAESNV